MYVMAMLFMLERVLDMCAFGMFES